MWTCGEQRQAAEMAVGPVILLPVKIRKLKSLHLRHLEHAYGSVAVDWIVVLVVKAELMNWTCMGNSSVGSGEIWQVAVFPLHGKHPELQRQIPTSANLV